MLTIEEKQRLRQEFLECCPRIKYVKFYRDPDGAYLWRDARPFKLWKEQDGYGKYWEKEANATAITGDRLSLCWTTVSTDYLRKCKRVELSDLPDEWFFDECFIPRALWFSQEVCQGRQPVLPWPPPGMEWIDEQKGQKHE